jgi:hypothetical protein
MNRLATGLLVFGLLAVGLAAVVDALRGGGHERPASAVETVDEPPATVAALTAAGVRGTLTYSDDHCRLHAVRLPALTRSPAPTYTMCEPVTPSGGLIAWKGNVVWSGLGFHTVQVVLSRADMTAAVRHDPQSAELAFAGAGPYEATQVVALGGERFAVVLDHQRAPWERLLGVFEGGQLVDLRLGIVGPDDLVRPSPRGTYFALIRPQDVQVFRSAGGQMSLPHASRPHAVAWSPDDRWTALATRYSIYVFPTARPSETVRIPLSVRDLDWGP